MKEFSSLISNLNLVTFVQPLGIDNYGKWWLNDLLIEILNICKEMPSQTAVKTHQKKRKRITKTTLEKAFIILVEKYHKEISNRVQKEVKNNGNKIKQ